jgi:phage tail sheath protein FI
VTAADDGTGTLVPIMDAIRLHTTAPVIVVALDALTLANAVGSAATFTHAFRFLQAEAELGVKPAILAQCLVGEVESDLIAIGNKLAAHVYLDGPNTTDAAAIAAVATAASQRVAFCDPAFENANADVIGLSVLHAAVASTLNFWETVSNKVVLGVEKTSRSIGWAMGDATSQAQLLNNAKISTLIRSNSGWRLWGGLSTSADAQFKFHSVSRTDDVIAQSIQAAFIWAVDAGITKTFVEDVVESVKAFLRGLKAQGAIIDGTAWADKDLNTPTSIAAGNLFIDYDFTPIYPAFSITMRRHLTNEYLTQIFG